MSLKNKAEGEDQTSQDLKPHKQMMWTEKKKYYFNYLTSDKKKVAKTSSILDSFESENMQKTHPPKFEKVEARQIRIVFQGEPGSSDHRTSRPYYIEANTAG